MIIKDLISESIRKNNKFYYFSYGMNTLRENMIGNGFDNQEDNNILNMPETTSDLGAATLPGWILQFRVHCDIDQDPKSTVKGVLWMIDKKALKMLDLREGYPEYYTRSLVTVITNNKEVKALVYYMNEKYKDYVKLPNENYLKQVVQGYKQHNIQIDQIVSALKRAQQ